MALPRATVAHERTTRTAGVSDDRRDMLLDVAARMVAAGEIDKVSMEAVALDAGVSRALVYKHFANRHDLLASLYERESALLHEQLRAAVGRAQGLEEMLRALVTGALDAQANRGATFAALASRDGLPAGQRDVQRRRDARTVRFFTQQAVAELGLDEEAAAVAMRLALRSIAVVLDEWRVRRTNEHAAQLAEVYVQMVMGGLRCLAASKPGASA